MTRRWQEGGGGALTYILFLNVSFLKVVNDNFLSIPFFSRKLGFQLSEILYKECLISAEYFDFCWENK